MVNLLHHLLNHHLAALNLTHLHKLLLAALLLATLLTKLQVHLPVRQTLKQPLKIIKDLFLVHLRNLLPKINPTWQVQLTKDLPLVRLLSL
jgi:hypothetical protein